MVLSPAWTTDWMSERRQAQAARVRHRARRTVRAGPRRPAAARVTLRMAVKCPRCDSLDTRELARFGSTSCKALYECRSCLEPFDFFKVL